MASAVSGDPAILERAARLLGAAQHLRDAISVPVPPDERPDHERVIAVVRTALGDAVFAAAWATGAALSLDQAIAEALEEPSTATATHGAPGHGNAP